MENAINNNSIILTGTVVKEPEYSHEVFGEGYYVFIINCSRKSGNKDVLPVMISDRLTDIKEIKSGQVVAVGGQIRSFNKHVNNMKSKMILSVFAREFKIITQDILVSSSGEEANWVLLEGYICKQPIYRCTPKGREISDIMIAVNRPYGKSDYIPCIAWGRNARFAGELEVGEHIQIQGRFQSREYTKKISDSEVETRTAYEVSLSRIDYAEEGEANE